MDYFLQYHYDQDGQIIDAEFNFVEKTEFDRICSIIM